MLLLIIVTTAYGTWVAWECECQCGKVRRIPTTNLTSGHSQGCKSCSKTKVGAAARRLLSIYKRRAKSRGLGWSLTDEQFYSLTSSPCFYTGTLPSTVLVVKSGETYTYNGVDRRDNKVGYTVDNSVPCASLVNRSKSDLTLDDFITMCQRVAALHTPVGRP
jgi:hypothetical protein